MTQQSRELKNHIVEGDILQNQLTLRVTDQPGAGGANHRYEITGFDTKTNPSRFDKDGYSSSFSRMIVLFQNGPIKEAGVNGITQEVLLAIVIDRLRSFQAGPFHSEANSLALKHCELALFNLQARTRDRIARGVEGRNIV